MRSVVLLFFLLAACATAPAKEPQATPKFVDSSITYQAGAYFIVENSPSKDGGER